MLSYCKYSVTASIIVVFFFFPFLHLSFHAAICFNYLYPSIANIC